MQICPAFAYNVYNVYMYNVYGPETRDIPYTLPNSTVYLLQPRNSRFFCGDSDYFWDSDLYIKIIKSALLVSRHSK